MQPDNSNAWAVRVGENVHYAKSLRDLRDWRNEFRISDDHDVWSPVERRWKKVGELDLRSLSDKTDAFLTAACGWVLVGGLTLWLGYSCFVAPFTRDGSGHNGAQVSGLREHLLVTFGDLDMRIEPRQGANLRIYISRKAFEDVPFPDRQAAVEALGQHWCASVHGSFLPSMYIHDIRTGKELVRYDCTWYNFREWWRKKTAK